MTYEIEEFKQWLTVRGRLTAWTAPKDFLALLSANEKRWKRGIDEKNLDGWFNDKNKEFRKDFVEWITEVDSNSKKKQ